MSVKSVFIVWYSYSRRAKTLAAELGGQVSFQYERALKGRRLTPIRYLAQCWKTWQLLERERPDVVLVPVPPIFAHFIVAVWCELRGKTRASGYRTTYVIDCHTGSFSKPWRWALPLLRLLARRAAVTLVASEAILSILKSWNAKALFLLDGIPTLNSPTGTIGSRGEARVAVICTFRSDEPIAEVFDAARLLPHVTFYLTGDPRRGVAKVLAHKPENVVLTGFISDSDYIGLLNNVLGVVDLTIEPNVLNSGIYEALSVGKPAVISDWPQLRRYFARGFIYVNNTPGAIAVGVEKMLNEQAMLTAEIIAMRSELAAMRQSTLEELHAFLTS